MKNAINILYIGNSAENIERLNNCDKISMTVAPNTLKAINHLLSDKNTDAIICETSVPGGDGLNLHEWLRERSAFSGIPFILVSFEFRTDIFLTALEKQVNDYYVTPIIYAEDLVSRIHFLREKLKSSPDRLNTSNSKIKYIMPFSKRLFDIIVAGTTLLFLSPLLLIIMLAIRFESKGKVYYISKRVGRKPFDFYKFRSMRSGSDAELKKLAKEKNQYATNSAKTEVDFSFPCPVCKELDEGQWCSPILHINDKKICDYWYTAQKKEIARSKSAFVKIANDPRITRVGKFIRNTSIDELPQLFNILKGDMSIVGNRPLPVYEAELLTVDALSKRFLAPPGLTGLWQVELRGRGGVMSEDERKRLDNEYADHFIGNNYSFWFDMKLILRTIPALFQKDNV